MNSMTFHKQIAMLPEDVKSEVIDFMEFLLSKRKRQSDKRAPDKNKPCPKFGSGKGMFTYIADDFDEPLDDFKDYMY